MAREFSKVGVVGLGTMGAGIVEVFARNGLDVVGGRGRRGRARARPRHLQHSTDRAVARGKLTPRTRPRCSRTVRVHAPRWRTWPTATWSSRRCPSTSTSSARSSASSTRSSARTRSSPPTPRRCRSPRSRSPPHNPRRVVGMHFFNPAPVLKFVEVIRTVVTEDDVVDDVEALRRAARQDAGRRRRQGRLHRQRAAVRLPQPRRRRCSSRATPPARTSTPR